MAHFFSLPICNYISSKDQFRSLPKDSNVESTVKSAEIERPPVVLFGGSKETSPEHPTGKSLPEHFFWLTFITFPLGPDKEPMILPGLYTQTFQVNFRNCIT